MKRKVLKIFSIIIAPLLILQLANFIILKNVPSAIYTKNEQTVMTIIPEVGPFNTINYSEESLKIRFLGVIPIKSIKLNKIEDLEVIPGGNCIGVKLSSKGVLVVGFSDIIVDGSSVESPAKKVGIEIGDLITKINNIEIESTSSLIKTLKDINKEKVTVELIRNNEMLTRDINLIKEDSNIYKIGLWIRDTTAGVGTLTFYDEKTGKFGALGHPVTDGDTNKLFDIKKGDLIESSIISIKKGEKGDPGELRGIFLNGNEPLGEIKKNTECGIFGECSQKLMEQNKGKKIKVGFRDEIKEGKAKIIATIDENPPQEYDIEIVKLYPQSEIDAKSMLIKITDERLLNKTGGIVQGMSGSPIIQDNKLVGAVTHVLINKPDIGYGIYIDWMLQESGIIK